VKTRPIEILVIFSLLILIITASLLLTWLLVPILKKVLNEYHILGDAFICIILLILFSALTVRMLISFWPFTAESFDMLSKKAFYWKAITSITEIGGMYFLPFVPLFMTPLFYSLFGARIGKNSEIAGRLIELPLITIREYVFIGRNAIITAHAITHNNILLKPVVISRNVTIGLGAIIMPGVEIGENSVVAPGSVVTIDKKIPPNELWAGIPAKKVKDIKRPEHASHRQ
jgi:serine acetyltransferase